MNAPAAGTRSPATVGLCPDGPVELFLGGSPLPRLSHARPNGTFGSSHQRVPGLLLLGTLAGLLALGFPGGAALAQTAAAQTPSQTTPIYATALEPGQIGPNAVPLAAPDLALKEDGEKAAESLARFTVGMIQESEAELEKAIDSYLAVLERDPGYVELAVKVAYEFTRRGDVPRAIGILKDAIKANPKEQLPYLNLAHLYARYLKKPDLAIRYATQGLEADPTNLAAYQGLYEIYFALGQESKALQVLDRAARLKSDDPEFWLRLGDLMGRLLIKEEGTTPEADATKIGAIYERALKYADNNPSIVNRVADFYVATNQIKKAIPLYLSVLEHRDEAPDELVPNVQEKLARSFLISGQREEAIRVLEEMVSANPLKYESYEFLGQLEEESGDFEKALNAYSQSLLLNPNQPLNHLRVAESQLKLQRFDDAIATLVAARKRFHDVPQISYSLAMAYSQAKKHEEALSTFEEALHEAELSGADSVNGNFYFNYGATAEQAGRIEKAAELFKKAIELDPSNAAQALNYLAYMWIDRNTNLEEAGKLIRKALELDPSSAAYIDTLGWYYYRMGDYEKAIAELLRAAEMLEEEDAVVFDHIGDTYQAMGNFSQALIYWTKALVLDPKSASIAAKVEGAKKDVTSAPAPKRSENTRPTTVPQ